VKPFPDKAKLRSIVLLLFSTLIDEKGVREDTLGAGKCQLLLGVRSIGDSQASMMFLEKEQANHAKNTGH